MSLQTNKIGTSTTDTGHNAIEITSMSASRQQTLVEKTLCNSIGYVPEDAKNEETAISANEVPCYRDARNNFPSTMEKSPILRSKSEFSLEEVSNFISTSKNHDTSKVNPGESHFEDEHDATDDQSAFHDISFPSSQQSPMISPSDNIRVYSDNQAIYTTQERQDQAFVQKFWTAYDEILILSLFTQIGILCRLGAAYWFRYFDDVFHSNSALFTNLPLNCLSCFVMGLLCSGESLMQIIMTRFTPPRLQHDLHRVATLQQLEAFQENEMSSENYNDSKEVDNNIEILEIGTDGLKRRGWRRRRREQRIKKMENEIKNTMNRSSSYFRPHHQKRTENPEIFDELREVQLLAWERRIRASVCLLLFPVEKEDVDIVENYSIDCYRKERSYDIAEGPGEEEIYSKDATAILKHTTDEHFTTVPKNGKAAIGKIDDLILEEEIDDCLRYSETKIMALSSSQNLPVKQTLSYTPGRKINKVPRNQSSSNEFPLGLARVENSEIHTDQGLTREQEKVHISSRQHGQVECGDIVDEGTQDNPDLDQIISSMATGVSNKISFISRVNLANGWDVGTSPQEKSEDLTLGLRDGLCGALSSFSSWISSMVNLFRAGQIGQAFVGLVLGIQLPIVAYRFGQYVSVYIFVWRCRQEKKRDEKRGYGIQLHTSDEEIAHSVHHPSSDFADDSFAINSQTTNRTKGRRTVHDEESDVPSIRAIFTALFITCLVAQLTSLTFFKKPEDRLLALSLLFSPLGVLTRWRMMKFNSWRPSFPLGTFACNVTACALSGTLGTLLAGNPDPRERIALVSIIAGFGGTLSSVARFIVEILSLMDPILLRLDGIFYAVASVGTGLIFSFLFAASVDWADSIE